MKRLSYLGKAFKLTMSLDKTVMYQPMSRLSYIEQAYYVDDHKLKVVYMFTYLGRTVNQHGTLGD